MSDDSRNIDMLISRYALLVQLDGMALETVPERFKTWQICRDAVKQNHRASCFVPDHFKTDQWWLDLVQQNGLLLEFMPDMLKTLNLCFKAICQNGLALQFTPKEYMSESLCLIAVRRNGMALQWVPYGYKTNDLCIEAIKQNSRAIVFCGEYFKNAYTLACQYGKFSSLAWRDKLVWLGLRLGFIKPKGKLVYRLIKDLVFYRQSFTYTLTINS